MRTFWWNVAIFVLSSTDDISSRGSVHAAFSLNCLDGEGRPPAPRPCGAGRPGNRGGHAHLRYEGRRPSVRCGHIARSVSLGPERSEDGVGEMRRQGRYAQVWGDTGSYWGAGSRGLGCGAEKSEGSAAKVLNALRVAMVAERSPVAVSKTGQGSVFVPSEGAYIVLWRASAVGLAADSRAASKYFPDRIGRMRHTVVTSRRT